MCAQLPAGSGEELEELVRHASALLGLAVTEGDRPAVVAHLGILRAFASRVGDPTEEPAAVFHP